MPFKRNCLFLLLLILLMASGSPLSAAPDADPLKVGLRVAPPFAFETDAGNWSGIAVDLWEAIAAENGFSSEYETYRLSELLEALEAGAIDVAVAPLTITAERERVFDFSMPFMQSGLAIATEVKPSGWWHTVKRFISLPFLQAAGALGFVIAVFGFLMWVFERRRNEMFGGTAAEGLGSGFWWSAVTMTTVGYGDKAPVTLGGRIVGLVWMFAAIIIISGFTASIASSLTVGSLQSGIEELDDLRGERVGVIEASSAAAFLGDQAIRYRSFATLERMMTALETGEVAAVVHDRPILRYELARRDVAGLSVLPEVLQPQGYAFGLPSGSPLSEAINRRLLEITQGDSWRDTLSNYLGGF